MGRFVQKPRVVEGDDILIYIKDERTVFVRQNRMWFVAMFYEAEKGHARGINWDYRNQAWRPFKQYLCRRDIVHRTAAKFWQRVNKLGVEIHHTICPPSEAELREARKNG